MKHTLAALWTTFALLVAAPRPIAAREDVQPADANWRPVPGKMLTRWAKDVTPEKVHPEYPRPQLAREQWMNLNGLWDYAIRPKDAPMPEAFDGKILVPFPVESTLSGVGKPVGPDQKLWYRRTFTVPPSWQATDVRVNFGAVDWDATIYANGKKVGTHRGGYASFEVDLGGDLGALTQEELARPITLVVEVADPSDAGYQPRGKQVRKPGGIFYTPTTGIWQTVWIEPVRPHHIDTLRIDADADAGTVSVLVQNKRWPRPGVPPLVNFVQVYDGDRLVASGRERDRIVIPDAKRWSPESPHLYRLVVRAVYGQQREERDGLVVDEVRSYVAFRKLSRAKDDKGVPRLLLNDKPIFMLGTLDQGFWPDGLYTAPTDAALLYDLEVTKRLGFNTVRKHVKVEPARWYYHCDRLGLLVWQDMPSGDKHIGANAPEDFQRSPESMLNFEREWEEIIATLRNHPCIVMWVPFNEGWGQSDTQRIAKRTSEVDPTRWVNNASGWTDRGAGDVLDLHIYPGPTPAKASVDKRKDRALVLGEFGGLGLPVKGHTWQDEKNWGYRSYTSQEALTDAYVQLLGKLHPLLADPGYCAAIYTQTTDVETEVNGLMTYDREVIKLDEKRATAAALRLYGPPPVIATLVADARQQPDIAWQYTADKPADGWERPGFDSSGWMKGVGGFGTAMTPGAVVRTEWKGRELWLRREIELPAGFDAARLYLQMHHDEDADVYLNGVKAISTTGYTRDYELFTMSAEARQALKPGKNLLAIRCVQRTGGQYIDAGIVEVK
jgi:hypothetical protein